MGYNKENKYYKFRGICYYQGKLTYREEHQARLVLDKIGASDPTATLETLIDKIYVSEHLPELLKIILKEDKRYKFFNILWSLIHKINIDNILPSLKHEEVVLVVYDFFQIWWGWVRSFSNSLMKSNLSQMEQTLNPAILKKLSTFFQQATQQKQESSN